MGSLETIVVGTYIMIGEKQAIVNNTVLHSQLIQKSGGWVSSGSKMSALYVSMNKDHALILELNGKHYLFEERAELGGYDIRMLQDKSIEFGRNHQESGSVSFPWEDRNWSFLDIGRTAGGEGDCRFLIAKSGTSIMFVLDHRDPQFADVMWIGSEIDPGDIRLERLCEHCKKIVQNDMTGCPGCGAPLS